MTRKNIPTASPRDAVEVAFDLFFRARHDPSLEPSVWDEVVDTFDEQQHAQLEDVTRVFRLTWPSEVPFPNMIALVRWREEAARISHSS